MFMNRLIRPVPLVAWGLLTSSLGVAATPHFTLTSSDPRLTVSVPEVYTAKAFGCSGGNASPPLAWRGAPAGTTALPAGALQGRSDLGEDAYHGPCPAKGDPPHRYVFTVYALDVAKLDVPADSSGAMVTSTAQEHVIGKAVLVAHYGR